MREIRTLRATWRGLETWCGSGPPGHNDAPALDPTVETEVMQRGAGILVPCGSSASVAAKRQESTIPIVFISVGNPIGMGLVESLSHPGHNATGFSDILAELGGKLLELARELSKPEGIVDYLWHTGWPDGQNSKIGIKPLSRLPKQLV